MKQMVNEGFLLIGKMVLGIFIIISLKVARPASILGYPGPRFIPFHVFGNQPLIKMSGLPSNNAAVVWSSPLMEEMYKMDEPSAWFRSVLACAHPSRGGWSSMNNSGTPGL